MGFMGCAFALGGCISLKAHVDPALGYVTEDEKVEIETPQPVQLVFEFQSKGATNARATKQLSDLVYRVVSESELFSEVSKDPVENGALLSITLNNVPQDGAAAKGFATGLTFGLAGSTVSDFYEGQARYVANADATEIASDKQHAIHSVVGAGGSPEGMTPSANVQEAVDTMAEQIVQHLLNELALQPDFAGTIESDAAGGDDVAARLELTITFG